MLCGLFWDGRKRYRGSYLHGIGVLQPFYHNESVWRYCEGLDVNSIMELLFIFVLLLKSVPRNMIRLYFYHQCWSLSMEIPMKLDLVIYNMQSLCIFYFLTYLATTMTSHPSCELWNRVHFLIWFVTNW